MPPRDCTEAGECETKACEQPVVLMVDDDEDDCMLGKGAFKQSKAPGRFYCVEDGSEMFDYLFHAGKFEKDGVTTLPALILLDLNMPRKDGRQALREIKSIPAFQGIPIVIFTTSRDKEDRAYCLEIGANAFITKPSGFPGWVKTMKFLAAQWLEPGASERGPEKNRNR